MNKYAWQTNEKWLKINNKEISKEYQKVQNKLHWP